MLLSHLLKRLTALVSGVAVPAITVRIDNHGLR